MSRVAIDFGTSNSVVALLEDGHSEPHTLKIPGITREIQVPGELVGGSDQTVHLVPTLIHYEEHETWIGGQVLERGLTESAATLRWMKRSIAYGVTKRRRTPQGHKGAAQAGEDFLRLLLNYVSDRVSFANDEFVFTAPVEAFEDFRDWLERVAAAVGIRRFRLLDEATASILGHQGAVSENDRFLIFDCGCGTLDVSIVRVDLDTTREAPESPATGRRAIQLGQAGEDLGGMDIDRWLVADFCRRHGLDERRARHLETALLPRAEALKIALSAPGIETAELALTKEEAATEKRLASRYTRSCAACERRRPRPSTETLTGCLGCLLVEQDFPLRLRQTTERALENAAIKVQLRKEDLTAVLTTGGTSLVPAVRELLEDAFEGKVMQTNPFDAVVRGACRGLVVPLLQHDYAIESYNKERKQYEFRPLFPMGTSYPTAEGAAVRLWARGSYGGMTRIGIKIFEVSRLARRTLDHSLVDEEGVLQASSNVVSDHHHICLNTRNPTFVVADPPVQLARDAKRFLCEFRVDGNRHLRVSVLDNLTGEQLLKDHAVVRL
jgi:molecular chaperone DnaK